MQELKIKVGELEQAKTIRDLKKDEGSDDVIVVQEELSSLEWERD